MISGIPKQEQVQRNIPEHSLCVLVSPHTQDNH